MSLTDISSFQTTFKDYARSSSCLAAFDCRDREVSVFRWTLFLVVALLPNGIPPGDPSKLDLPIGQSFVQRTFYASATATGRAPFP